MEHDADKHYRNSTIGKYVPKHKEKEIRAKQAEWHKRFPGKAKTEALKEKTHAPGSKGATAAEYRKRMKREKHNPFGDDRKTDPRIG